MIMTCVGDEAREVSETMKKNAAVGTANDAAKTIKNNEMRVWFVISGDTSKTFVTISENAAKNIMKRIITKRIIDLFLNFIFLLLFRVI